MALRAGISVLVPLLVVVALGHPEWSAYAAFPAFTSLYGRTSVHLSRAVMQLTAGAALTAALLLATEFVVGRNYGLALLFITPLALLMGELALSRPAGSLLVDRGVETAIGAVLAVLLIAAGVLLRRHRAAGEVGVPANS